VDAHVKFLREVPTADLLAFTTRLSTRNWRELTDADFVLIEEFVKSDGCTGVPEFYHNGCVIHDFWYRTHRNLDGTPIEKKEADLGLKQYVMSKSPLGHFSIISWLWYRGTRVFAGSAWREV